LTEDSIRIFALTSAFVVFLTFGNLLRLG
jgi:hypothetical protein